MDDYTLIVFYPDQTSRNISCPTLTDVSNEMHSVMRSCERPDVPHKTVEFHVQFNRKD
jgi:hypothetical protein